MLNLIRTTYVNDSEPLKPTLKMFGISLLFGVFFAVINYFVYTFVHAEMDFWWSIRIAEDVLAGRDPYAFNATSRNVPYPLPVFLFGILFIPFSFRLAGSVFIGISVFLLTLGMQMHDEMWRLPMFLSFPFFGATIFLPQWAPIIMAAWFFPMIAPYFVLVKPQNALPIGLAKWNWKGIFISAAILLFTLIIDPTWPIRWLSKTGDFAYIIPFMVLPFGPLLLLSVRYWRIPEGRLLFFMVLFPIRAAYDLPILWLITKSKWQAWVLTILSWVIPAFSYQLALSTHPRWAIPLLYLPALLFLIWNEEVWLFFKKEKAVINLDAGMKDD